MGSNYPTASSQILACGIIAPAFSKSLALQESMQNRGRQLSNFFEFFHHLPPESRDANLETFVPIRR